VAILGHGKIQHRRMQTQRQNSYYSVIRY